MDYTLPFLWVLNGFLAFVYMLAENVLSLLMLVPLTWVYLNARSTAVGFYEHTLRMGIIATACLSLLASALSPQPVGFFLTIMAAIGAAAFRFEKFRPDMACWNIVRGMTLYALIGIGFYVYSEYLRLAPPALDPGAGGLAIQGQSYLSVIISIALYAMPIVWMGYTVKELLVHPPVGNPTDLIDTVRSPVGREDYPWRMK